MSAGVERGATAVADVLETAKPATLLESAQAAGSVTQDEIALALDELDLDAGQIDDFYRALEEMQVDVVGVTEEPEKESCRSQRHARSRPTRCSSSSRTSARSTC